MGFIFQAIRYLFIAIAMISWMLTAYARAEDINLAPGTVPVNETVLQWGLRISTSMMYFMMTDLLKWIGEGLTLWHERPPWQRFASILFLLLVLTNLQYILKERRKRTMLTIYCPVDNTRALPIPGSYNRYRCLNRRQHHQFSGEPHVF